MTATGTGAAVEDPASANATRDGQGTSAWIVGRYQSAATDGCTGRSSVMTVTMLQGTGARADARWSADTHVVRRRAARRFAGTDWSQDQRGATTGTRRAGTDAARRVMWRRDGRARWRPGRNP